MVQIVCHTLITMLVVLHKTLLTSGLGNKFQGFPSLVFNSRVITHLLALRVSS